MLHGCTMEQGDKKLLPNPFNSPPTPLHTVTDHCLGLSPSKGLATLGKAGVGWLLIQPLAGGAGLAERGEHAVPPEGT